MNAEDTGLEISCTWEIINSKHVSDAVTFSIGSCKTENDSLENIVNVDTCIHLINRGNGPTELKLGLGCMKSFNIRKISVVSEARIIELFGKCEEYITTVHADFFDECEDMSVYIAETEIPQPTSECYLKFARLRRKDEMWLYGIHITFDKADPIFMRHPSVNFQNVNRILKDSGHQLTEKAEKCKKFLQLYGSFLDPNKTQNKVPDPQILMKMFEAEYLAQQNPLSSKAKTVSKCITEMLPGFSASMKDKNGTEEATALSKETENNIKFDNVAFVLKQIIDKKFNELEKTLMVNVEEKFKELERKQNEKLNLIISKIEELKMVMSSKGPEG
ncbi:hypothetical protein L9F63_011522 [Diploptera punctata]|uniref:Uncharacterized protein n=1 Tax=Diploptera punctata TaxID=6984 RepID=A0AAD8AFC9_DIPPU|nr:hypothetical protein L9F63_011522 [Diploptera punctata]